MSVQTVEFLGQLFKDSQAMPKERAAMRAAFRQQITGPTFDPTAISEAGKRLLRRLEQRAAANVAAS